jgi:hypothetical protein
MPKGLKLVDAKRFCISFCASSATVRILKTYSQAIKTESTANYKQPDAKVLKFHVHCQGIKIDLLSAQLEHSFSIVPDMYVRKTVIQRL